MIVDTMKKEEVLSLLRKDCDLIIEKLDSKQSSYKAMCMKLLGVNKKKYVTIPIKPIESELGLTYLIDYRANIERFDFRCSTIFFYRGNYCFADFTQEAVSVFSSHSLDRYSERVLNDRDIGNKEVFSKYLSKEIDNSFHIVLSTQTHKHTVYYLRSDALFLGDFISKEDNYNWYNTCLSIDELFESQYRIYNTLGSISRFVQKLRFDPIKRNNKSIDNTKKMENYLKINSGMTSDYLKYLRDNYKLYLLIRDLGGDEFSNDDEFDKVVKDLRNKLIANSINPDSLDPYDEKNGVAIRGELDFIGMEP